MKCSTYELRHIFLTATFLALFLLLILSPKPSLAAGQRIYLNEVMWNGSSVSSSDEWLELINLSDAVIDLSGWSIYDEVKNEVMVEIKDGQIAPQGHYLVSNNDQDHLFSAGESILNIKPDLVDSSVSLSNTEFKISIKNAEGEVIDQAGDTKKPWFGKNGDNKASMQRKDYEIGGDKEEAWEASNERKNLDENVSDFATPENSGRPEIESLSISPEKFAYGQDMAIELDYEVTDSLSDIETIVISLFSQGKLMAKKQQNYGSKKFIFPPQENCPTATVSFFDTAGLSASKSLPLVCYQIAQNIKLNEVLPHPKNFDWNQDKEINTADEWIEIINYNQKETNLSSWSIKDLSGHQYQIPELSIPSYGYAVFFKSQTGLSLNDSGDTLYLFDPEGKVQDELSYPSASNKYDLSYAKWDGQWLWTTIPTPGKENQIIQPGEPVKVSYEQLKETIGKQVIISGELLLSNGNQLFVLLDGNQILIKLLEAGGSFEVGQILTIKGLGYGGAIPYILSHLYDIKAEAKPSSADSNIFSEAAFIGGDNQTIRVTIKKKTSRRLVFQGEKVKPLILGQNPQSSAETSRILQFMLYSMGLIVILAIVFVYDVCCRF